MDRADLFIEWPDWSPDSIVSALQHWYLQRGRAPRASELAQLSHPTVGECAPLTIADVERTFGSLHAAAQAMRPNLRDAA